MLDQVSKRNKPHKDGNGRRQPGEGPKKFGLVGAAGFIAPRHLDAIRKTGNEVIAAIDPNDSVGILDSYFPQAHFFVEFERFDRHIDKLYRKNGKHQVDYISICSPNYLHDAHVRFALRSGADAICEKPLVLNPWNLDGLEKMENETGRRINTILQLRLHPSVVALRQRTMKRADTKHDVEVTYITSRGRWYQMSWKGDERKSGGIATNIGVHFFDMLHFVFGSVQENRVHFHSPTRAAGYMELEKARVRWFLSLESEDLPKEMVEREQRTYRSITVDGAEFECSGGFAELHQLSYERILAGEGFGLNDSRVAIQVVSDIRNARPARKRDEIHPFLHHAKNARVGLKSLR